MKTPWPFLAVTLVTTACSRSSEPDRRSTMSEREKDSVLAASPLPGAKVVGKAITASDAEAAHTAALDSASQP
jgi:hypothetical protein